MSGTWGDCIYHGIICSEFFKKRLYRKKEPTTYFKWIKIQRNHATYVVTFLWPVNVPTFIRIILIVFYFALSESYWGDIKFLIWYILENWMFEA